MTCSAVSPSLRTLNRYPRNVRRSIADPPFFTSLSRPQARQLYAYTQHLPIKTPARPLSHKHRQAGMGAPESLMQRGVYIRRAQAGPLCARPRGLTKSNYEEKLCAPLQSMRTGCLLYRPNVITRLHHTHQHCIIITCTIAFYLNKESLLLNLMTSLRSR